MGRKGNTDTTRQQKKNTEKKHGGYPFSSKHVRIKEAILLASMDRKDVPQSSKGKSQKSKKTRQ